MMGVVIDVPIPSTFAPKIHAQEEREEDTMDSLDYRECGSQSIIQRTNDFSMTVEDFDPQASFKTQDEN